VETGDHVTDNPTIDSLWKQLSMQGKPAKEQRATNDEPIKKRRNMKLIGKLQKKFVEARVELMQF
jgi:hypothetical protein